MQTLQKSQKAFTLIELIITIAVLSIIIGIAIPNYLRWQEARRLIGIAEIILADLYLTQAESVKRGEDASINITPGTNWNYTITTATTTIRTASSSLASNVSITLPTSPSSYTFNSKRGTINSLGTNLATIITIQSTPSNLQASIRIESGIRFSICGSGLGAYPSCST